jgi:uncharacterized protein
MHIVDRRLNPSGKNLANRQRFMRRAKSLIRKAVHESSASRSIKDADTAGEVALPAQGVHEPSFHRGGSGGIRDHLLPGNRWSRRPPEELRWNEGSCTPCAGSATSPA